MKKVLVVVDMQKDFIDGSLGTKKAVAIVPSVVEKIESYKAAGDIIYFTMDTHTTEYLQTQEGRNLPVEHCIKGTAGWRLEEHVDELAKKIDESSIQKVIFEKGIFGSEQLAEAVRDLLKGEKGEIELVGVCTDICVLANAMVLKTYMPEVKITVDASCCAGVTPESHINALNAMKMCQIQIINEA